MQFWSSEIEKQVGARVQIVLKSEPLMRAYQRFGADVLRRSSVFHGLEQFLVEQKVSGDRCFEIGTWNGLTAVVLSQFFSEVVTVDIAHNPLKHEILEYLGIKNVRCVDIANNAEKAEVARKLTFDFAYLDGNHADDTLIDFDMTRKCGRVLMHEAWPHQAPVWGLVAGLPRNEVNYGGAGLALWVRK